MNDSSPSSCPRCGSALPADTPGGLCPKCALSAAAATAATGFGSHRIAPPDVSDVAPHFPDLEVVELIGAGGMGAVYKARQPRLDRFIALKILLHDPKGDPAFVERFNREAKVLAKLNHPNIVTVHDFGTAGPFCFLVMEHVDGINLREAMRAGGFPPAETLALVQDVCGALQYAHGEGILHRDIKPENILLDSRGRVKIADFGIAKLVGDPDPTDVTLTMQGSALGSPHYMAPEQFESPSDVDARADIYSLGVVFYEMLTGELPLGRFDPPSEKSPMDPRVDQVVMRSLERNRQRRYQSAGEVGSEVENITRSGPVSATPAPAPVAGKSNGSVLATTSAILTGLSLFPGIPLLGLSIYYFVEEPRSNDLRVVFVFLSLGILVTAVPALLGTILGWFSLGGIRRSGGRREGLGRALFGATTWLVILIPLVSVILLRVVSMVRMETGQEVHSLSISIPLALGLFFLSGAIAGSLLVRGARRWAACDARYKGAARYVLGIITMLLLPSLAVVAAASFLSGRGSATTAQDPERDRLGSFDLMPPVMSGESAFEMNVNGTPWLSGRPEVKMNLALGRDVATVVELIRIDASGTEHAVGFDKVLIPRNGSSVPLAAGTTEVESTGGRLSWRYCVVMEDSHGGITNYGGGFRGQWKVNPAVQKQLYLDRPGRRRIEFATCHPVGSPDALAAEKFVIEFVTAPIPEGVVRAEIDAARIREWGRKLFK